MSAAVVIGALKVNTQTDTVPAISTREITFVTSCLLSN